MLQYCLTWLQAHREEGQDLAEYALLLALIAIVVIVALLALGPSIRTIFENITGQLQGFPTT